MGFTKNFRTPVQLTGTARAAFDQLVGSFGILNSLFPVNETYDINFDFNITEAALPAAASFRSFNTHSDVGVLGSTERSSGKLPPISRRLHVDEHQQLIMFNAGGDAIGLEFERYATSIAQSIASRFVLAQRDALVTGKVLISERDLSFEVDFKRKAGLTVNAGTAWSNAAADVIGELEALRTVLGRSIGRIVISRQTMNYLQLNTAIRQQALGRGADLTARISADDVRSVFSAYDLGNLVINEDVITDQTGAVVPLFAADKVIILPAGGPVGRTALGVTAESLRTDTGIAAQERPGVFAGALESDDPSGYDVLVSAIGLPILSDANATAVIDAF
jgi:hypothetical protein